MEMYVFFFCNQKWPVIKSDNIKVTIKHTNSSQTRQWLLLISLSSFMGFNILSLVIQRGGYLSGSRLVCSLVSCTRPLLGCFSVTATSLSRMLPPPSPPQFSPPAGSSSLQRSQAKAAIETFHVIPIYLPKFKEEFHREKLSYWCCQFICYASWEINMELDIISRQ